MIRDWGSVWRGVRAMRRGSGPVNTRCWRITGGAPLGSATPRSRFWAMYWTPVWSDGRGPYLSVGLGVVACGRGY